MEEDHPRYMFKDPQEERESRDRSRDPVELADQCLAELTGSVPSTISRIDLGNQHHAKASECMEGYVTDRLATLGQDPETAVDHKTDNNSGKVSLICPDSVLNSDDPMEMADQCLAELEGAGTKIAPRDVTSPPRDVTSPSRDDFTKPRAMNRRVSAPAMQGNPRGFKTHVPGIFDKIQARLDSAVKLVEDEMEEDINCKPNKIYTANEHPVVKTENKPAPLGCSPSVLNSDEPLEIADQCLAEFEDTVPNIPPRDVITPTRDVVPPLRETIKPKPPTMNRRVSAPAMQGNPRGFKTHVPGIFDKIQARLDSSVKLVEDEMEEGINCKPNKTSKSAEKSSVANSENRLDKPDKPAPLSRSSSVLSSDDPLEIADQCLAEFEGTVPNISRIDLENPERVKASECLKGYVTDRLTTRGHHEDPEVVTLSRDVITPPRGVITPPRDVITPPRDVVPPLRETIKPKPPVMNRRVSAPAMHGNPRGFKTHVPGIFDKIQARLDSSTKLVDDDVDDVDCKPNKMSTPRFADEPEDRRPSKPAPISRSSSVLSSDDPIEIADQCLAEFEDTVPNIPPCDVITPPCDVITPPRDVITPPRDVVPPLRESIKPKPPTMNRRVSAPAMQGNPRGFKTHVPGIFDKIQARLDSSVKLVDKETDNNSNKQNRILSSPSRDATTLSRDVTTLSRDVTTLSRDVTTLSREVIDKRLNDLEPDGFQYHVPDVFNKIQQKLYFSPEVKDGGDENEISDKTSSAELLKS